MTTEGRIEQLGMLAIQFDNKLFFTNRVQYHEQNAYTGNIFVFVMAFAKLFTQSCSFYNISEI